MYLRSIDNKVGTIRFVVVAWAVLTVLGFIALFFATVFAGARRL